MSETNAQEPTMEEILASIRRIISEDDAPAAGAEPAAAAQAAEAEPEPEPEPLTLEEGDDDDVLELTQPAPPEPAPQPAPAAASQALGDIEVFPRAAAPAPEPAPEPAPVAAAPAPRAAAALPPVETDDPAGLTGAPVADHAASMFGQLSRTLAMPAEGRTIEDVVRELLRPLLKDWLDQNLPTIVEAAVQSEVERIARRRSL